MKTPIASFVALVLSACGTTSSLSPGQSLALSQTESMLLLRVTPQYKIHLLWGKIDKDSWIRPHMDIPEVNITPGVDGYVFVRIKINQPGEKLGVSLVFPDGKPYGPCEGSIGPTFDLEPGSITYAGDLSYQFDGRRLQYSYLMDESDARSYVERNFGPKHPPLRGLPMTPMTVRTSFCEPAAKMYIPIYIPRGR